MRYTSLTIKLGNPRTNTTSKNARRTLRGLGRHAPPRLSSPSCFSLGGGRRAQFQAYHQDKENTHPDQDEDGPILYRDDEDTAADGQFISLFLFHSFSLSSQDEYEPVLYWDDKESIYIPVQLLKAN